MKLSGFSAALCGLLALSVPSLAAKAKVDKFTKLKAQSSGSVTVNDASFNDATAGPRDYWVATLLTALPAQFGCAPCREFQPEWELLASQWNKADKNGETKVLFTTADFPDNKQVFAKLMLQTAPRVMMFPPTTGPGARPGGEPLRFEFTQGVVPAEQVHSWIARQLPEGFKPEFKRPINWFKVIVTTVSVLTVITATAVAGPYILPVVQNRNVWAAIALMTVLLFTSGHMYNHIRKVPYVQGDGKGGVSYFASGFQSQYGMETQIVAAMYGVLSFATIALALKVPRIEDAKGQQVAVVVWAAVMWGMYSFLMSIFRIKNGGFPFYLPPF